MVGSLPAADSGARYTRLGFERWLRSLRVESGGHGESVAPASAASGACCAERRRAGLHADRPCVGGTGARGEGVPAAAARPQRRVWAAWLARVAGRAEARAGEADAARGGHLAALPPPLPPPTQAPPSPLSPWRAAAHAAAAEMRLLAQSYAITNWDAYKAANNISGWVPDNSVPVRCPARIVPQALPRPAPRLCVSCAHQPWAYAWKCNHLLRTAGLPVDGRDVQPRRTHRGPVSPHVLLPPLRHERHCCCPAAALCLCICACSSPDH